MIIICIVEGSDLQELDDFHMSTRKVMTANPATTSSRTMHTVEA